MTKRPRRAKRKGGQKPPAEKKRPGFYLFPKDWLADSAVQGCSWEARGLWIDMLCLMWDQNPRGVLPGKPTELARMFGIPVAVREAWAEQVRPILAELLDNDVYSLGVGMDDQLPPGSIVNRRMFKEFMAEIGRSEAAKKAAQIRWSGGCYNMRTHAEGYADSGCASDADFARGTDGDSVTCDENAMRGSCAEKLRKSCLSLPYPTEKRSRSSESIPLSLSLETNVRAREELSRLERSKQNPADGDSEGPARVGDVGLLKRMKQFADTLPGDGSQGSADGDSVERWVETFVGDMGDQTLDSPTHRESLRTILGHPAGEIHLARLRDHAGSDKITNPAAFVNSQLKKLARELSGDGQGEGE